MRYCPTCDAEFRDDKTTCTDDETPLLERAAYEAELARTGRQPQNIRRLVQVALFDDRFEADELARDLAEEGLNAWLVRTKTPIVGMLTPGSIQWAIVVPEREFERAEALLAEWRPALEGSRAQAEAAAEAESTGA